MSFYKKTFLKKFISSNNLTQTLEKSIREAFKNVDNLKKEKRAFEEFQKLDENNIKKYENNINKKISNKNFYERLIDSVYNLGLHITYKYVTNTNRNQILYNKFYDIYTSNKGNHIKNVKGFYKFIIENGFKKYIIENDKKKVKNEKNMVLKNQ